MVTKKFTRYYQCLHINYSAHKLWNNYSDYDNCSLHLLWYDYNQAVQWVEVGGGVQTTGWGGWWLGSRQSLYCIVPSSASGSVELVSEQLLLFPPAVSSWVPLPVETWRKEYCNKLSTWKRSLCGYKMQKCECCIQTKAPQGNVWQCLYHIIINDITYRTILHTTLTFPHFHRWPKIEACPPVGRIVHTRCHVIDECDHMTCNCPPVSILPEHVQNTVSILCV